jgi:hypothetical protein
MSSWIFLSKGGRDPYINTLARGSGGAITNTDDYDYDLDPSWEPLVMRGILKHKIMKKCREDERTFYYMDSGYFGNDPGPRNPRGDKIWHRIVRNDLQHTDIVRRPPDRWSRLGITLQQRRHGSRIVVAAPDEKPCRIYGIDLDTWIGDTVAELKKYTDREIIVRQRAPNRVDRVVNDRLSTVLVNDVHALVTFNSVAATESIILGVPAFTLAPVNAAAPVANQDLSRIENPYWPTDDQRVAWVSHLAYGQFHVDELKDGTAYRMLNES